MRCVKNGWGLFAGVGLTMCVMLTAASGAPRDRLIGTGASVVDARIAGVSQDVDPIVEEPIRPLFPDGVGVDRIGPDACGTTGVVMPSLGLFLTLTMRLFGPRRWTCRRNARHSKPRYVDV